MAGRPGLRLLALLVLLAHVLALDWFAGAVEQQGSVLKKTAPPMFTRLLKPEEPAQVVAAPPPAPKPAVRKPRPPEVAVATILPSIPETTTATAEVLPPPPGEGGGGGTPVAVVAETTTPSPSTPDVTATTATTPSLASWPVDTRLNYRLGGIWREGELYGDARVQWHREGSSYQVRLDIDITPWVTMVMTSQGEVTENGLLPKAYEEERRGKRRAARFGDRAVQLEGGRSAPKPDGVQDSASQFVELSHRFATGQATLEVGQTVSFWMARPSAVDLWTYDVVKREVLQMPVLGAVEAFHLKPRPIANPRGNVTMEMWFAPSLQYLPVRIKVNLGEQAYVDLMVEKIEQR